MGSAGPPRGSFFCPPVDSTGRFPPQRYPARRDSCSEGVCSVARLLRSLLARGGTSMNNIIYLIGLVVVVVAILGYFGLR